MDDEGQTLQKHGFRLYSYLCPEVWFILLRIEDFFRYSPICLNMLPSPPGFWCGNLWTWQRYWSPVEIPYCKHTRLKKKNKKKHRNLSPCSYWSQWPLADHSHGLEFHLYPTKTLASHREMNSNRTLVWKFKPIPAGIYCCLPDLYWLSQLELCDTLWRSTAQ